MHKITSRISFYHCNHKTAFKYNNQCFGHSISISCIQLIMLVIHSVKFSRRAEVCANLSIIESEDGVCSR